MKTLSITANWKMNKTLSVTWTFLAKFILRLKDLLGESFEKGELGKSFCILTGYMGKAFHGISRVQSYEPIWAIETAKTTDLVLQFLQDCLILTATCFVLAFTAWCIEEIIGRIPFKNPELFEFIRTFLEYVKTCAFILLILYAFIKFVFLLISGISPTT